MEKKWEEVFNFLSVGAYPSGYNKSQKLNLRRHASKFTIKEGELFFGSRRAIKTKEEARMLFTEFHSPPFGGHSGIVKTRTAICSKFYWHGMTVDVDSWVLECDKCQKVGKNLTASQQFIKVSTIWEFVGIDLTGPVPKTVNGFEYILTATDLFSKWVEAFPLKTKSAAEVGHHICSIIYRHGCPNRILSDEGTEFVNELNHSLCSLLGIERSVIAAYHPQTNCVDKKTNDNVKRALTKLFNEKQNNWDVYLDATLFSLRSKVNTTTKHSPFLLMYGREAVFPSEVPVDMPDSPPMQAESLCLFPEGRPHPPDLEPKCKVSEMDVLPDSSEQEVKEELPSFLDSEATVSNTNCEINVLVGVTGSVAALKLPLLVSGLLQIPGVQVQVVSTEKAKHFYHEHGLGVPIYSDKDEWEMWSKRTDPVLHIELRRWAHLLLIAPLDANTLGKICSGICDNLLTCVVRAWDLQKPLLFCPAMNTAMWDHPITAQQIAQLHSFGYIEIPCVAKRLVCGDEGLGAMAEVSTILDKVKEVLLEQKALG